MKHKLSSRIAHELNRECKFILQNRLDNILPIELDNIEIQAANNKFVKNYEPLPSDLDEGEDHSMSDSFYAGVKWALRKINKEMSGVLNET